MAKVEKNKKPVNKNSINLVKAIFEGNIEDSKSNLEALVRANLTAQYNKALNEVTIF